MFQSFRVQFVSQSIPFIMSFDDYFDADTDTDARNKGTRPLVAYFSFNVQPERSVFLEISHLRRIYYGEAYAKPDAATALLLQYVDDLNAKNKDPRYLPANLSHLDIPKVKEQIKAEAAHHHLCDKLEAFKMTAKPPTSPALARCVRYEKELEECRAEGRAALPRMKLHFESKHRPRMLDILRLALCYGKPSLSTKAIPVLSKQFTAQDFADALNHWGLK